MDEVMFDAMTGVRGTELKRVEPRWVERAQAGSAKPYLLRIPAPAAKNRRERIVGLSGAAFEIIRRRMAASPKATRVFAATNFRKARAKPRARRWG